VQAAGRKWDRRIDRACELAETYPFAREILLFYSQLTGFQKSSYLQFQSACGAGNPTQSHLPAELDEVDLGSLLTRWRPFLAMMEGAAPKALAEFVRGLSASGREAAFRLLRAAWPTNDPTRPGELQPPLASAQPTPAQQAGCTPFERICAHAFLQPFAEFLADHADLAAPSDRRPSCPYCGSPPLVGVLRPEGEGAKRSLVCSFCRTEWGYARIACPACDERREDKLCVYAAPRFETVRVEACDTCRAYIIAVDITRNGLAVPEVDALAAIPLTLWADESGYQKVTRNILCL